MPEQELVKKIGLDAVIFLRFIRMLRNVFLVFSIIGLGIFIPLNVVGGHPAYDSYGDVATLLKFTPQYIYGYGLSQVLLERLAKWVLGTNSGHMLSVPTFSRSSSAASSGGTTVPF